MPSKETEYPWPTATGKLEFLPPNSTEESDLVLENVTPARRDWLPDLLEGLLPWFVEAVQEVAKNHDPRLLNTPRQGIVPVVLEDFYDVTAVSGWYSYAAADFTVRVRNQSPEDWPTRYSEERPDSVDTLVNVGTGLDELNTSIDALEPGPVQLITIAPTTPSVSLLLDESAWRNTQRQQRKQGLKTIAILSKSCAIDLVAPPSLEKFLEDRHPEWLETYLTESNRTSTPNHPPSGSLDSEGDIQSVIETLEDFIPGGGRLRLLAAIPSEKGESREVRNLKTDSAIDLSPGTIDRYYRELEQKHGLFSVDDRGRYNSVTLTPAGRYAQSLLTEEHQLRHPQQARLSNDQTTPPQPHTSLVLGTNATHPAEEGDPLETCLEASAGGLGQPSTRRLSPAGCWLTEQELVDRHAAGQCAHGITLVNDRIPEFDDGRATYFGHSGDEVHAIVQWGNPIPTLARIGATLLSEHAFDQILTRSRVDPLLSGTTAFDALRLGRQLGWLSDSERNYTDLCTRYKCVSTSLLHRLGSRNQSPENWSRLCSEAHGLLATATNLYDAAGFDLTIHIRLPDTDQLTRDDSRYNRFIDFMKETVPKNAAYQGNSAPRMLLEEDGDKLGYRLPVDIDETERDADLTADWVVVGPDVTSFRDDLIDVFNSVSVREQVATGAETGIRIPIEIATANTYSNLHYTVETLLNRIGRPVDDCLDVSTITDFYVYAFGNVPHNSLTCSPFDIAEALIAADRLAPSDDPLTTSDLAKGLGAVSSKKLYPWLPPSARELLRALFEAGTPLKRSEILDAADISQTSYERHRANLEDSGLFTERERHHYDVPVPGQWPVNDSPLVESPDADTQEWILHQKFLKAQIQAHTVHSLSKPTPNVTRICIG